MVGYGMIVLVLLLGWLLGLVAFFAIWGIQKRLRKMDDRIERIDGSINQLFHMACSSPESPPSASAFPSGLIIEPAPPSTPSQPSPRVAAMSAARPPEITKEDAPELPPVQEESPIILPEPPALERGEELTPESVPEALPLQFIEHDLEGAADAAEAPIAPTSLEGLDGASPMSPAAQEEEAVDFELMLGQRWMTWLGVGVLFLCAAFFLKYGFDKGWLRPKPWMQVIICAVAGLGVLISGAWMMRKRLSPLSQGLAGLGMAILYLTFAAAASERFYDPVVLSKTWAFIFMAVTTFLGLGLASRRNAQIVAILAVIGGLATPVLVSTGVDQRDGLFTSLLILSLGAVAASWWRKWRWPDLIACVGVWLLFFLWAAQYPQQTSCWPAIIWAWVFFGLFRFRRWTFWAAIIGAGWVGLVLNELACVSMTPVMTYLAVVGGGALAGSWRRRQNWENLASLGVVFLVFIRTLDAQPAHNIIPLLWAFGFFAMFMIPRYTRIGAVAMAMLLGLILFEEVGVPRDALLTYLMAVNLAVLGYSLRNEQKWADIVNAAGTAAVFGAAAASYESPTPFPLLCWLGGFYLVYLTLPFARYVRWRTPIPLHRFVLALAGVTYTYGLMWLLLFEDYRLLLAHLTLTLSAVYLLVSIFLSWRIPRDKRSVAAATVICTGLLTLSLPLYLNMGTVPLAWAIEGVVLLYLGYMFRNEWVRGMSGAVLAAAAVWHLVAAEYPFGGLHQVQGYVQVLLLGPAAWWAWSLVGWRYRQRRTENEARVHRAVAILAGLAVLGLTHYQIFVEMRFRIPSRLADAANPDIFLPPLACAWLWLSGMTLYLLSGRRFDRLAVSLTGFFCWAMAAVCVLVCMSWRPSCYWLFLNPRFLTALGALALLGYAVYLARLRPMASNPQLSRLIQQIAGWVLGVGLWLLLTVDVYGFVFDRGTLVEHLTVRQAELIAQLCLTMTWGLYAVAVLILGFGIRQRPVRLAGMGLLLLTAAKLLMIDMAQSGDLTRIITFLVVGLAMLGAAWLYHKLEKRLSAQ